MSKELFNLFFNDDKDNKIEIKWRIEKIINFFRKIKYFFQKIFRSHHTSDTELWNLYVHLSKILYKKIKAYKDMNRVGYPGNFSYYDKNLWKSREEYNKLVKLGKIISGEGEAWEAILNKMLFSFEYIIAENNINNTSIKKFYKKYNLDDPREEIKANKIVSYVYEKDNGDIYISNKKIKNKDKYIGERVHYYNIKKEEKILKEVQEGINLFAKFFMSLWD